MRRVGNLYEKIISFENLLKASRLARRWKRFKAKTARFELNLENELWTFHRELKERGYRPKKYHHFVIFEPKRRIISAAPYRDRVLHHAIHNILEPIFDPTFIHDSYATRKGKGTHAAINRFQEFSRVNSYVLKCDIKQYFPSINHEVLRQLIRRKIKCPETLNLIKIILDSHATGEGIAASQAFLSAI